MFPIELVVTEKEHNVKNATNTSIIIDNLFAGWGNNKGRNVLCRRHEADDRNERVTNELTNTETWLNRFVRFRADRDADRAPLPRHPPSRRSVRYSFVCCVVFVLLLIGALVCRMNLLKFARFCKHGLFRIDESSFCPLRAHRHSSICKRRQS
jgi:hypothetical protein